MNFVHYWKLLTGRTKAKHPAKLTLRNIKAVFQAYWRKGRQMAGFTLPTHQWEQIVWRRTQVIEKSRECWNSASCINCGCEILGKTMEDRACEWGCYPPMMSKENWKMTKKAENIKIFD